jgi:hypothetical protein
MAKEKRGINQEKYQHGPDTTFRDKQFLKVSAQREHKKQKKIKVQLQRFVDYEDWEDEDL